MGAKVQTKNCLPGYYSMHDFMVNPTSSWSSYCQDKRLSEHIFNTYIPRLVNGCSEQDKEMLKQTMLEHEAIFRKQIYELHRLYRIQKDLMHDSQTRNFDRSSVPAEISYSSSFSSQRQPEYTETISQMSHFPVGVTSWGNMPCVVNDKTHPSFKRDGHVRSDQIPFPGGASQNGTAVLDCKPHKRTFDPQLSADVYMDIEDRDGSQKNNIIETTNDATIPKNETLDLHPDSGKKLTSQSDEEVNHQVSNLTKRSCRSARVMVDLNKPSTEISCEAPTNSASNQLFGMKPHNKLKQGYLSSLSSNTNFLDRLGDQQTSLRKDVYSEGEWPFFNHESGKKGSTVDDFSQANNNNEPNLSERLQLNSNTCREGSPCDHNSETGSRQEPTPVIRSPIFPSIPTISTSQADITSCTSSFASSWRKIATSKSNMLVAAHAPSSFRQSSYLNNESLSSNGNAQIPTAYCQKWQTSRSSTTSLGTAKTVPYTNVMDPNSVPHPYITSRKLDQINNHKENFHGHLLGNPEEYFRSRDLMKTSIDLHLNQALPSGMEDVSALKQDQACYDVCNKFAGGASWHNIASNGHSKLILRSNVMTPNIQRKGVKELDLSARNLQEATSALQFTYHKIQGDTDSEKNGKRIIGFPIDGVNEQSSILVSTAYMEKLLADKTKFTENDKGKFTDFSCETKILNLQKKIQNGDSATEIGGEMNSAKFRPHINLNAEFACADDSIPSEPISEGELVVQSSHSISIFGAKIVSGADLQTSTCRAKTNIMNQDKHISSNKKDDSEKKNFCDQLVRFAAENLFAISVDSNDCHNDIGSNMLCLPQFDTLCWFAEVVSHSSENLMLVDNGKNQYARSMDDDNNCHGDHDDNAGGGLDLFEAMTLELEEVKVDQQCCRAKENDAKDDKENAEEVKSPASMLFTQPRRGQGKKRRQRRDFQKDVLSGLASLSRLQVSEDLQSIWGMMKASGRPWQVSSTKRNTGQNPQRKGRMQQKSIAITVEDVQVTPHQPSPLGNAEIGVDGSSMIGWGRTTRRCRRRRCLPGNLVGSLS